MKKILAGLAGCVAIMSVCLCLKAEDALPPSSIEQLTIFAIEHTMHGQVSLYSAPTTSVPESWREPCAAIGIAGARPTARVA